MNRNRFEKTVFELAMQPAMQVQPGDPAIPTSNWSEGRGSVLRESFGGRPLMLRN